MMRPFTIILFSLLIVYSVQATDGLRDEIKYPVSTIKPALMENAHAVVRKHDKTFIVVDRGRTIFREHLVVTILNEKAETMGYITQYYNPISKIKEFKAWVYDESGKEIDKLRKSDIKDQSMVMDALYADYRIQYADMRQPDYPYTVEFITEKEVDKYYETYDFMPLFRSNLSVEQSSLSLIGPEEFIPRFREVNYAGEREETSHEQGKLVKWELTGLKAVEYEPYSTGLRSFVPHVETAPSLFEYDGYTGDMTSWESFGKWIWNLNSGRGELPQDIAAEVKRITNGLPDREKVKVIYEFMQNRTRYVNISLGIGALQPFEASVVNNVGYGDCKALSNYTISLLREAGIEAYYVLIFAGDNPEKLDSEFPAHAFNHAIVNVPLGQDTVWLECTSQTKPFNHMGSFTGNREALMITEDGGVVVRTPKYSMEENLRIRNVKVEFDETGNAYVEASTRYQGIHYDITGLIGYLNYGEDIQKKWVHESTQIPNYDLVSFDMENIKNEVPSAVVDLQLGVTRYASKTGKRFYFVPNIMSRRERDYKTLESRKSNFIIQYDLAYTDTVEYNFPSSYQVEYLPEPMILESEFGRYEARMEFLQGKLRYYRKFELYEGEYPPEKYNDFVEYSRKIESMDKAKVVFTTKT